MDPHRAVAVIRTECLISILIMKTIHAVQHCFKQEYAWKTTMLNECVDALISLLGQSSDTLVVRSKQTEI